MGFDNDEDVMLDALAEFLGVDPDLISLINPNVGEDLGSTDEGFHYGYCFEFPAFDDLDDDVQDSVVEFLKKGSNAPFGETVYLHDGDLGNTEVDPFGWRKDTEYEFYQKYLVPKPTVLKELESLELRIHSEKDDLVAKALLLSCFVICEAYVRTHIWSKIPDLKFNVRDPRLRELLDQRIEFELRRNDGRRSIYKHFARVKLPDIPHFNNFRNALAHDIASVRIQSDRIFVNNQSGSVDESIGDILRELKAFIINLL